MINLLENLLIITNKKVFINVCNNFFHKFTDKFINKRSKFTKFTSFMHMIKDTSKYTIKTNQVFEKSK